MKTITLASLLLGGISAMAQQTETTAPIAFTSPVGYSIETLRPGMNLFGLTLHQPVVFPGRISDIGSDFIEVQHINDDEIPGLVPGETYILEITSGKKSGVIQELTKWEGLRLTVAEDLQSEGIKPGDLIAIRRASSLNDVFPPASTPFKALSEPGDEADIVFIPEGAFFGEFRQCVLFRQPGHAPVWVDASTLKPVGGLPLIYPDGLIVHIKGISPVQITLPGQTKPGPTRSIINPGLNLVATPFLTTPSLQSLGLEKHLVKSDNFFEADKVWLADPDGFGAFRTYFLDASGAWCEGAGEPVTTPAPVSSAILIERMGESALITLGN